MPKAISLSSGQLLAATESTEMSDKSLYGMWRERYAARFGPCEFNTSETLPFDAHIDVLPLGAVNLANLSGTFTQVGRTKQNILDSGTAGMRLYVNKGVDAIGGVQRGREFTVTPGAAVLLSGVEPFTVYGNAPENAWMSVMLPDHTHDGVFRFANDRASLTVEGNNEALTMLHRYIQFLNGGMRLESSDLKAHAAETIVDLVCIAAGLRGQNSAADGSSGLRAARAAAVLTKIQQNFSDPEISAHSIAQELRLSARYVYDLLQQSGHGFSERVLELRLQKTRAMLTNRMHDHLKVSEIALSCGFNDISHFNRCFRRRFGCTPGVARRT